MWVGVGVYIIRGLSEGPSGFQPDALVTNEGDSHKGLNPLMARMCLSQNAAAPEVRAFMVYLKNPKPTFL